MGKLALAAKITHVPSMYLSELPGARQGTRQDAIDGHIEIGRRCRELGVDTIVVFDTHWLVNANYHINCAPHFEGLYTSNELPHFISNMSFEFPGNPVLGKLLHRFRALQLPVDAGGEHFEMARLADDSVRPRPERSDGILRVRAADDQEHRNVAMHRIVADHPGELDSRGSAQIHVTEHEIDRDAALKLEEEWAVIGRRRDVGGGLRGNLVEG